MGQQQGEDLLASGHRNIVKIGDVFRIRRCRFRVTAISFKGITAEGISEADYCVLRRSMDRRLDAVGESLIASHEDLARGRRRNEPCPCGSGKKYKRCSGTNG